MEKKVKEKATSEPITNHVLFPHQLGTIPQSTVLCEINDIFREVNDIDIVGEVNDIVREVND